MVAELFPRKMNDFALEMSALTTMVAGPIGGYVGALTAPTERTVFTKVEGLAVCLWSCLFNYRYFCRCNCWYYVDCSRLAKCYYESTRVHFVSKGTLVCMKKLLFYRLQVF